MKNLLLALTAVFAALTLSSCCMFGCKKFGGIATSCCENDRTIDKEVVTIEKVSTIVDPGPKGGAPYEVIENVAHTETVKETAPCGYCLSTYCPTPDCCDIVSKAVLRRRTAQGSSGEPHIGLIPTMKTLAP